MKSRLICWSLPFVLAGLFGGGCAPVTSKIYFADPPETKVTLPDRDVSFVMPTMANLAQTEDPKMVNLDAGGEPIRLELADGTRFKGYFYVFHCKLDQVEKLVRMEFSLTEDRIQKLKSGQAVTIVGLSSKGKPIYKITIGLDQ